MFKTTINYANEKFLITNEPVMNLVMDVLQILNKINKITIKGKDESCPATVSVANIITQNMLKHAPKYSSMILNLNRNHQIKSVKYKL